MEEDLPLDDRKIPLLGSLFDDVTTLIDRDGFHSPAVAEFIESHQNDHEDFPAIIAILRKHERTINMKQSDFQPGESFNDAIQSGLLGETWKLDHFIVEHEESDEFIADMAVMFRYLINAFLVEGIVPKGMELDDDTREDPADWWKKG